MLRAPNLSSRLSFISDSISKSLRRDNLCSQESVIVSLASGDGSLIASSTLAGSLSFESGQRVAAVAASISLEYTALERLMGGDFRSFCFSSEKRFVHCSRVSRSKEAGPVLLIVSVPESMKLGELESLSLCRAIQERIQQDVLPSLYPVFDHMLSAPPSE